MLVLGKKQISIGKSPDNDIVITDPTVGDYHAKIIKQKNGLFLVDLGVGQTMMGRTLFAPYQPTAFDFRAQYMIGNTPLDAFHPSILSMIFEKGQKGDSPFIVGRDPSQVSLVISHPAVSNLHATLHFDNMQLIDHGSTSGTYLASNKIPSNQWVSMASYSHIAFGPIYVGIPLLMQMANNTPSPFRSKEIQRDKKSSFPAPDKGSAMAAYPVSTPGEELSKAQKHHTVIGEISLQEGSSQVVTIGRTPENNIVVAHAQVSSKHALIHQKGDLLFIEDRGSANGTFVRGQRLIPKQLTPVKNGERVYVGPMPLVIQALGTKLGLVVEDEKASWSGRPLYEIEALDLFLEVSDRENKAGTKVLLDHLSFKALPGDMIALMGPSGAGKTTLLLALNGYFPPTSGQVRVNGEDLYTVYDALRGSIGYVPQDDLVHPELTVFEAVKYSAKFRLPPDYSDEEVNARVEETLQDLGLESLRHLQIGKPEKKILSGGQRKRVNIALELVTDPVLLFLDEPTSGLASDDTTSLITLLEKMTKKTGKTIIMTIHQPAKDEYEKFSHVLVMGYGGIQTYFGPTGSPSYDFFGSILKEKNPLLTLSSKSHPSSVDNPRDLFEMLHLRENWVHEQMKMHDPNAPKNAARLQASRLWRTLFFSQDNPVYHQMYSGRRTLGSEPGKRGVFERANVAFFSQWLLLMSRYWKVKLRDKMGAAIMFLQAPIIGFMLLFVFGKQKASVPFWCLGALQELSKRGTGTNSQSTQDLLNQMTVTSDRSVALFFVVVSSVWFGTSNAAREIVTERAIYLRERMVNLSLLNYVLSKLLPLSFICILQCFMLLGIVYFGLGFHGGFVGFLGEFIAIVSVAINATALGLLLSTVVQSAEAAMALTPIALIPQVVLGGLMVPMTTNYWLKPLMYIMPARWGFEGAISYEREAIKNEAAWLIDLHQDLHNPSDFIFNGKFQCALAQVASENLAGAWGFVNYASSWLPISVLFTMSFVIILVLLVILKRRDPV